MRIRKTVSLLLFLSLPVIVISQSVSGSATASGLNSATTPLAADIKAAIEYGHENPGTPYHLRTNCTDDKGIRGFKLYPDGVAIWNKRIQIRVPESIRTGLLQDLLKASFYDLEPSYGGKKRLEEPKAGFRVSCQVWLEIGETQKLSVQQADGEQSAQLKGLAAALLNRVEPLLKDGLSARSLQDGLDKLVKGELAPQTFRLRYIELPPKGDVTSGFILRILDGTASRQAYSPGHPPGPELKAPLKHCDLIRLSTAIKAADMGGLPNNLWSDSQIELEVEILGYKKAVLARPFSRLRSQDKGVEQQRFDELIAVLQPFDPQAGCDN